MEKNDDSPEDVKRATSVEREIKKGEKDDTFEGYPRQEKKRRWEHCDKAPSKKSKRQKQKLNEDCCETRKGVKKKAKNFMKVSVFGEPCTFPKTSVIPRHCLTKEDYINLLAKKSRKCPPDCQKETVLRRLKPVSQRIKELAQPPRQRMLISLQQGAAILPPALLDNLVRTVENETCLTPEQAAIVSRKKKFKKKNKDKKDTSRQKETSKLNKPSVGSAITGSFDRDSVFCQYSIAERFVKSILKWKCSIPKSEFNDVSKVIVERLIDVLGYTPPQYEDRKSQQLRFLADIIACWMSGVLSDVAQHQEKNLEELCKKKKDEWAAAEEETDEEDVDMDQEEHEDADEHGDEIEDEDEDEDEDKDEKKDERADGNGDLEKEEDKGEEVKDNGSQKVEQTSIVGMDNEEKDNIGDVTESVTQPDDQDMETVNSKDKEQIDGTMEQVMLEEEVRTDPNMTEQDVETTMPLETVMPIEMETKEDMETIGKPKLVTEVETNTETETIATKQVETEEAGVETKAETETETEAEAEAEAKTEAEAEAEAKTEAETEMKKTAETKEETESTLKTETEAKERIEELSTKPKEDDDGETAYRTPSKPESEQVETEVPSTLLLERKVTPDEEERWKEVLIKGDLEELFKSDIPFVTFGKIIDTVYKMIESTPENTGEDPITNGIHRVIYEKLINIVMLEDPNLLTEELKDIVDVVCGKIANWLRTILSKSQVAFMEQCMPVVESKEIRDWTKWLEHISDVAIDWNIWLRGVIEKIFEMRYAKVTRGEWKDWTKSVDTGALLWRKFHLQTVHQAHRNITMLTGRNIVKTGTKTPCTASEQLIRSTELHV